ncbi:MAG: aspartate ammonia-lyase [Treponema sp.]|jgi:aspartate ammonia-lyase|nr:aspartate ammonia-lyase [Treponema sp.]
MPDGAAGRDAEAGREEGELRTERDFIGEMSLPSGALYGIAAARARDNFALSYGPVNPRLIRAMVTVKKAAALTLARFGEREGGENAAAADAVAAPGEAVKFRAVAEACDRVLSAAGEDGGGRDGGAGGRRGETGDAFFGAAFIVDALQGGAGTSINMNVNEVLANLALAIMGKKPGDYRIVHPLEDVNRFQSTNDVYPTALRIAAILLLRELSRGCAELQESLQKRETEFAAVKKLGRTELMDAVPVSLGDEFGAWAQAIARDRWRLYKMEERLRQINLGGQAVGHSEKAGRKFRFAVIEELRLLTGIGLAAAEHPMDITQNNDVFVEVSGLLKALAVNIMKISGDLRLMNSGPLGGLGEIRLAPLQAGSTIMPGKVNPVICEMAMQAAMKVIANDGAVTMAASRGEFELNAFLPLIADSLLESLSLLERTVFIIRTRCVELLEADQARCAALLENSLAFAYGYAGKIGYAEVERIIAQAGGDGGKIRAALEEAAGNPRR